MPGHLQERLNREQPQSALQTAVNATEPGYENARSTSTMEAELQLQDTSISPDSRAAEDGNTVYKSATLASPCGISDGTKMFKAPNERLIQGSLLIMGTSAGSTMRSAPGARENDHVKRATSPAGRACEGPPNTSKTGNEAAGALKLATRLDALLSELPKLGVTDKDGKIGCEPSDASLSLRPTYKYAERDAVHCEKEHDNANVTATPEGSISPETPRSTPESDIEEATSRRNGDGLSASQLIALLSELRPLCYSPSADQDNGDSDRPSCTWESTDSMPSPATSLSEHGAVYFAFADMSISFPATTGMVLMDEQSRWALAEAQFQVTQPMMCEYAVGQS